MGSTRSRSARPEPDDFLARQDGVAYRYSLTLSHPESAGDILRVLADLAIPLRYLLLLPRRPGRGFPAYLGLDSSDVSDFPLRLAALGVRIRRGEELGRGRR